MFLPIGSFQEVIAFIKKCHLKLKSAFYFKHVSISRFYVFRQEPDQEEHCIYLRFFRLSVTMAPEVKSRNAKTRRLSGQALRLRKKRWPLTGLKADKKYVGESF